MHTATAIIMFISVAMLILSILGYIHTSNDIINSQQKEINKLRSENFRLQASLRNKSNVKVIEIHDDSVDPENIPDYRKEW